MAGKRKGTEDDRYLWPEMLRSIREIQPSWVVGENVPGILNWSKGLVFEQVCSDLEAEGYEVWPVILPACSVNAPHKRERVWFVAYSNSNRNNRMHASERCNNKGKISENNEQTGDGWTSEIKRYGTGGITPNSDSKYSDLSIQQRGQNKTEDINASREDEGRNVTNSESQGHKKPVTERIASERRRIMQSTGFERFPTVPPVCERNDGIFSRLAGITFPKWRNKSIKAMGNAIVPQIAYQIFKVIDEINKK